MHTQLPPTVHLATDFPRRTRSFENSGIRRAFGAQCYCRRRRRRGIASLELAMFLPFLSLLLAVIFTVASVPITYMTVAFQSRGAAWKGRHQPWLQSDEFQIEPLRVKLPPDMDIGRILGDQPVLRPDRIIKVERELKIPVFYSGYVGAFDDARSTHYVMGGTWDHREIPFPEKARHRRLTPVKKFYFFARPGRNYDFSQFRSLAGFAD